MHIHVHVCVLTCTCVYFVQSENIQRWWPNGYGNQTMYNVYFVFTASNGDVTSTMKRIGFRKIELVQDPVSANTDQGDGRY